MVNISISNVEQQLNDNSKTNVVYQRKERKIIKAANSSTKTSLKKPSLMIELTSSASAIKEAQALRYQIFAEEMGAEVSGYEKELDQDHYDDYCQHLLVRDTKTNHVVGCTRILTQENAQQAGSFYSENEFDMHALKKLNGNIIEIGRTCIHPEYRNGAGIGVLWSGLAQFMQTHQINYMMGCASISMADGGIQTHAIMKKVREKHLSPEGLRVQPLEPLENDGIIIAPKRLQMPPLLKAYLRLGAWVAGEPCVDHAFNVADVFILLDVENLNARYHRHFIKSLDYYGIRRRYQHSA